MKRGNKNGLLKEIGKPKMDVEVSQKDILEALKFIQEVNHSH